jgi:hypothetical protein
MKAEEFDSKFDEGKEESQRVEAKGSSVACHFGD